MRYRTVDCCPMAATQKMSCAPLSPLAASSAGSFNNSPVNSGILPTDSPEEPTKRIVSTVRPQDSVRVVSLFKSVAEHAVLNCWHENEHESVAMWSLYTTGREGVAIQTTIKRLKDAFQAEQCGVTIARVRYVDYGRARTRYLEETFLSTLSPHSSPRGWASIMSGKCVPLSHFPACRLFGAKVPRR